MLGWVLLLLLQSAVAPGRGTGALAVNSGGGGTAAAVLCPHATQSGNNANCGLGPVITTSGTNTAPIVFTTTQDPTQRGWKVGTQLIANGTMPSAYNGTYTVTALTSNSVTVNNSSAPGATFSTSSGIGGALTPLPGSIPALMFGKQGTGTTSMAIPISVSNCQNADIPACVTSSGTLTLSSTVATLSGTNAGDFAIASGGTCTGGQTLTAGQSCTVKITFTPSQSAGTLETATLTIHDNGTTSTQTMNLTGISATVTTLSACGTISSNTNYQLTADVSGTGNCFDTGTSTGWDLNLNGHTITYGTATNTSSPCAAFMATGANETTGTVHNGIITDAGNCTGFSPSSPFFGSGWIRATTNNNTTAAKLNTLFNLTGTQNSPNGKVDMSVAGDDIHDIDYTDNDVNSCSNPGCRENGEGTSIIMLDGATYSSAVMYNITGYKGPQSSLVSGANNTAYAYNLLEPGDTTSTMSNGFGIQMWGQGQTAAFNYIPTCASCRGFQDGNANNIANDSYSLLVGNVAYTTMLNNNAEYACNTPTDYTTLQTSYGGQFNFANLNANTFGTSTYANKLIVTSGVCPAFGFSFSGGNNTNGPNVLANIYSECDRSGTGSQGCFGFRADQKQYSWTDGGLVVNAPCTFKGDYAAFHTWYDGTGTIVLNGCSFGPGTNPMAGLHFFDENYGIASGGSSSLITFVDPSFTGGLTKSSNNLSTWASNSGNSSLSASYLIKWTYTVMVEQNSNSAPINGASVSIVDAGSTTECTGSTNGSGVYTCAVKDTLYQAVSGAYSTVSYNPMNISISDSALGCTTNNFSRTFTGTLSETIKLSGC